MFDLYYKWKKICVLWPLCFSKGIQLENYSSHKLGLECYQTGQQGINCEHNVKICINFHQQVQQKESLDSHVQIQYCHISHNDYYWSCWLIMFQCPLCLTYASVLNSFVHISLCILLEVFLSFLFSYNIFFILSKYSCFINFVIYKIY